MLVAELMTVAVLLIYAFSCIVCFVAGVLVGFWLKEHEHE